MLAKNPIFPPSPLPAYLALSVLARKLLMWAGPRFLFGRPSHG